MPGADDAAHRQIGIDMEHEMKPPGTGPRALELDRAERE
jgi:hypothetical protein